MAALFRDLYYNGSKKSDGTANASGRAWFYVPGTTNTLASIYSDQAGATPMSNPVTLDSAGRAEVYTKGPVRVLLQDSSGNTVRDAARGNSVHATEVEVENNGFTGTLTSGGTGAGGRTHLHDVLTSAHARFGGTDFDYLLTAGATAMSPKDWMSKVCVMPQNFGARGDNSADDTARLQAALDYLNDEGGGILLIPPGTYRHTGLTAYSSIEIIGAGVGATTLYNTSSSANSFDALDADDFHVRGVYLNASSTTGSGIRSDAPLVRCTFERIRVSGHDCGVRGIGSSGTLRDFYISTNNVAAARGVIVAGTGVSIGGYGVIDTGVSGYALECLSGGNGLVAVGSFYVNGSFARAVSLESPSSGPFFFAGWNMIGATIPFYLGSSVVRFCEISNNYTFASVTNNSAGTGNLFLSAINRRPLGSTPIAASVANGATYTADADKYDKYIITAQGATATFATDTSTVAVGAEIEVILVNAAGGTTWTVSGSTKMRTGFAVANTASVRTGFRLMWDGTNWRQTVAEVETAA